MKPKLIINKTGKQVDEENQFGQRHESQAQYGRTKWPTLLLISLVLVVAFIGTLRAQDTWVQKADFGGTARFFASGFAIGSKGYISYGYDGTTVKDLWQYDPIANSWSRKADLPASGGGDIAVSFSIGNKAYVGLDDFWEYDPSSDTWTKKADFVRSLTGLYGFSIGGKGYLLVPVSEPALATQFWEYDPISNVWSRKADFPSYRYQPLGFGIGQFGYVGFGQDENGFTKSDLWEYNVQSDTWTEKQSLPNYMNLGSTVISTNENAYLLIGGDNSGNRRFWEYSPISNTWKQKSDAGLANRLNYAAGFSIDGKVYIGTGFPNNQFTKVFSQYTPGDALPIIDSFTPSTGIVGNAVNIFGQNFDSDPSKNSVKFNGATAVVNYNFGSTQYLNVTVPAAATTGKISITVGTSTGLSTNDFVVPAPSITSFSPGLAISGESIRINGANFSTILSNNEVRFNGIQATVTSATANQIIANVPSGATSGRISVKVGVQTVNTSTDFTVVIPPTISSFDPTSGTVGTTITVIGSNFDVLQTNNLVKVNGLAATVTSSSNTSLTFLVPDNATNGKISITVNGYAATSVGEFIVQSAKPAIFDFNPKVGPIGTQVTITGNSFNGIAANNIVRFGAVRANVVAANNNSLMVQVPLGVTYQPLSVTVNGLTANSHQPFSVTFPTHNQIDITSFAPISSGIGRFADAADMDGDGKVDGVFYSGFDKLFVCRNISTPGNFNINGTCVQLNTATSNQSIELADVDGDGKLDIIVMTGNGFENTISIFRNTSTPGVFDSNSFAPKIDLPNVNFGSGEIRVKDVDGDGRPEILVTGQKASGSNPYFVQILKNNTSLNTITSTSFDTRIELLLGTGQRFFDVGDLDGDMKPDIIAPRTPGTMVYKNNSTTGIIDNSTFSQITIPDIDNIGAILADINNDGKLDLVGKSVSQNTSTSGNISFTVPVVVKSDGFRPLVSDLDGDGKIDLAYPGNRISVYKNIGSSTAVSFAAKVDFGDVYDYIGTGVTGGLVKIVDMDGDEKPDFLLTGSPTGAFIRNNISTALPNAIPIISGFSPKSGVPGSRVVISGDNFSNALSQNVVWFDKVRATVLEASKKQLVVQVPPGAGYGALTVSVNGLSTKSGYVYSPRFKTPDNFTSASISPKVDFPASGSVADISVGDFNADGKPDFVMSHFPFDVISIIENTTTSGSFNPTSFKPPVNYNSGRDVSEVVVDDFDGDGKLDIAANNYSITYPNGTLAIHKNNTTPGTAITVTSFPSGVQSLTNQLPIGLTSGDIDGDGKSDIVLAELAPTSPALVSKLSIFKNTAIPSKIDKGSFPYRVNFDATQDANADVEVADLDGDGKLDVVLVRPGFVSIYRNTSQVGAINSATLAPRIDLVIGQNSTSYAKLAVADLDLDGKKDIIISNGDLNSISIIKNNCVPGLISPSSFDSKFEITTGNKPERIAIGDLNGDGKPDLAVANNQSSNVSVFKNLTTSSSNGRTQFDASSFELVGNLTAGSGTAGVAIADFDLDGKSDIIVTNRGSNTISAFHNDLLISTNATPVITGQQPVSTSFQTSIKIELNNILVSDPDNAFPSDFILVALDGPNYSRTGNIITPANSFSGNLIVPLFVSDGLDTSPIFNFVINVNSCASPAPPNSSDVSLCGSGIVTFSAVGAVGTQEYRWYNSPSGGSSLSSLPTFTTPSITATTSFYVSIFDVATTCESNRTQVDAIINTPPAAPTAISNSGCSGTNISIAASGATNGQYRWYTASTGGTAIAGQTNDTFIPNPTLTTTTSFWAAINNSTCESARTEVIATVLPLPPTPTVSPAAAVCGGSNITLTASGTTNGNYRWYDGANIMSGQVNSQLVVTNLASNKTFQVSIFDGTCEGNKANANASIKNCTAPAVANTTATAFIEGEVKIDLRPLISDLENDLDESSLQVSSINSNAPYSLSGMVLTINYAGFPFTGTDVINLSVCDLTSLCTTQTVTIELGGNITVYNAISPNGDNKNPTFHIQYIDILPETKNNRVMIYNRWGDTVFEVENYDNANRVFRGLDNSGDALPPGTYFYKIKFANGGSEKTGFIALRK